MNKTITIAGGTGFVGSYVANFLSEAGYKILISSRNPEKASAKLSKFEVFKWDPEKEEFPRDVLERSDVVINLIGETIAQRWTKKVKEKLVSSRVNSTRKIVEAFAKVNSSGKTFISASATGFYGSKREEVLTEDSSPGDDFLAKLAINWESEAKKAEELGVRTVILRIGIVLGKNGGFLARLTPIFKLGLGGKIGNGKMWMSWIHLEDLARVVKFAIENENVRGVYNVVSPNPVTNEEFTKKFAKVLKRPAFLPVPEFGLKVLFGKDLTEVALTSSQRVKPERLIQSGFEFKYPDIEAALVSLFKK
ncbi:MAG: TIGR01777 family oxidoreductase [Candidatus Kryptonium sp.]|nr:TIGR01777 family oxidoreductase [Candidatus Kryptonium sp.]MCX7762013.1 TIGR01777 family oxidoreductase [Candidatus Kryptonium sp.]MDW8108382.1 TIGR01777 family oxidoreductase [Candidatus Kryptonium sp.]